MVSFLWAFFFPLLVFWSPQAEAKVFRNSYVSFQLPSQWNCVLEQTTWVCRYAISKQCLGPKSSQKTCQLQRRKGQEAIIILTAKEKGPKDSLKTYYDYLIKSRAVVTRKGKRSQSKVIHAKPITVQKHKWVDGMHLGSEVPHYYTRYLATLKGNVAVLVTFSAHKLHYTKYSAEFFKAIKSLRVLVTKSSAVAKRELRTGKGRLGVNVGQHLDMALDQAYEDWPDEGQGTGESPMGLLLLLGALILAMAGVFVWMKGKN